jgi:hypothetical protein
VSISVVATSGCWGGAEAAGWSVSGGG